MGSEINKRYPLIIIEQNDNWRFCLICLDAPGCAAIARAPSEVTLSYFQDALASHFEAIRGERGEAGPSP